MTLLTDTETAQYRDAAKELLKRKDELKRFEIIILQELSTWSGRISKQQSKILETVCERLNNERDKV